MNITTLVSGPVYEGREKRDALIGGDGMAKLQEMERDMGQVGWAAETLDKQASAVWLSPRLNRPVDEVMENFDAYSSSYFGRVVTPAFAYDSIVKHEADSAALLAASKAKPAAPTAAPADDVKSDSKPMGELAAATDLNQFVRTGMGAFEKAGQDTVSGTFRMIEGVINSMGDNPEREGASREHLKELSDLMRMEAAGLDNTDEAERLRSSMRVRNAALDKDFLARKAEFENSTYRGALSSTAREHADFFFELGTESMNRYGSDPAYRETFAGKAAEMGGQMLASSAIMAAGALGGVGKVSMGAKILRHAAVNAAGGAQVFAGVSQDRKEFLGDAYRNEGWAFAGDMLNAGGQQALEAIPFLDNALEKAIKYAPQKHGTISWGEVLRRFPKEALKSGGVEAGEEVLQGAWDDFIVDQGYDSERVNLSDDATGYLKKRAVEAFAGFAGGVMMAGAVAPALKYDQNRAANKAAKLLTAKDGGLFMGRDFELLRQAKTDEQIQAMVEGDTLLAAANGDVAAQDAYNSAIVKQNFKSTEGMELPDAKLGMFEGKPALLFADGSAATFDMNNPVHAKRWAEIQQTAIDYAEQKALRDELGQGGADMATSDMVEYVRQLQAERGGVTTIETEAKIDGLEAQFGRVKAEQMVADYVNSGALPAGTTLDTLAPTRGASDTKWDDKTRQFVTAIRIAKGGDALVVMEESAHDYFKRQIELGQFNEATVDNWRKQVEAGWSGKMEYTEMHEWLAKYAVGYAMGKVQETEASNLPLSFKRFLDRFAKLFRESLDFAAKVMQMERDGVLPAQFLRALQEATGTADNRGVNDVPLMSELDQEMATEAMKADTFPKIEGNEEAGWTVSDPDGERIATASTLEDAQDKAMEWYMKQELEGEKQAAKNQGVKASEELQRVIIMKGGLLAPSAGDMSGELRAVAENLDAGKRLRLFRKNALSLDDMREALVGEGFQFQTVNDLLVALDESTRGNPVYARGGEETFSLSESRAKPEDASNVTVLPDGAQLVGPTTFSLTAYHGTPHKVDKFSTSKIGTGEGAQAYGWGLYFAESKAVADTYRKGMSPEFKTPKGTVKFGEMDFTDESLAADYVNRFNGDFEKAMQAQKKFADENKNYSKNSKVGAFLEKWKAEGWEWVNPSSNLYTVELLPDADAFLDWDKPLSEQSEKVKAALGGIQVKKMGDVAPESSGGALYNALAAKLMKLATGSDAARLGQYFKEATEEMARRGVVGIRYLDGASRGKGGTSNYVIFDESLVKIIEENGKKVEQAKPQATFSLSPILSPMEKALNEKAERLLGEARMAHWQNLGLKAIADVQAQTYAPRTKAVSDALKLTKGGTLGDTFGRQVLTIASEMNKFAPGLGDALNRTTHENQKLTARGVKTMVALGDKINTLKNANEVFMQFQVFGRRDDRAAVEDLAKIHGFTKELAAAEAELVDIRRTAIEAGVSTGKFWSEPANWEATDAYKADMKAAKMVPAGRVGEAVERVLAKYGFTKNIDFYWPSKVFDVAGLQAFIRGQEAGPIMTEAYRAIEAEAIRQGRAVNEADLTGMMAKLVGNTRGKSGPSALKGRTIANENINFAVMQFYYSPIESAIMHVESMRKNIQQRQFFGKSIKLAEVDEAGLGVDAVDVTGSTKLLLAKLAADGKISDQAKEQMSKLVEARFNPTPQNRFVSVIKALGYVTSLGQAYSGQTATLDALAIGLREDSLNPFKLLTGIVQAATGKNFITLEEMGVDTKDLGEGFITEKKWESRMVAYVFEKIGMKYFSRFYGQSGINQAMNAVMKKAQTGELSSLQQRRLDRLFGPRAEEVLADLAAGRKTDDVIFYAWSTYADYQPISQDQQSQAALTSNTGKMLFQFKGFLTVQFAGMRDNAINEIKSGDKKRQLEGAKFLLTLASALLMVGLPSDMLRSWLTGRTFILDEQICARLMGMIGISPYLVRETKRQPTKGVSSLMLPSFGGALDDLARDIAKISGVISSGADVSAGDVIGKMKVWQNLPVVGRIYGERLGAHAERNKEDREEKGWFILTAPEDTAGDAKRNDSLKKRLEKEFNTND